MQTLAIVLIQKVRRNFALSLYFVSQTHVCLYTVCIKSADWTLRSLFAIIVYIPIEKYIY